MCVIRIEKILFITKFEQFPYSTEKLHTKHNLIFQSYMLNYFYFKLRKAAIK